MKLNFEDPEIILFKILPIQFEIDRNERTNKRTNERQQFDDTKKEINKAILLI